MLNNWIQQRERKIMLACCGGRMSLASLHNRRFLQCLRQTVVYTRSDAVILQIHGSTWEQRYMISWPLEERLSLNLPYQSVQTSNRCDIDLLLSSSPTGLAVIRMELTRLNDLSSSLSSSSSVWHIIQPSGWSITNRARKLGIDRLFRWWPGNGWIRSLMVARPRARSLSW